jgi:hypothetical protein
VYVTDIDPEVVRARVLDVGRKTAESFFRPVITEVRPDDRWAVTSLTWTAWYADYGDVAHVRFYVTQSGSRTVVFVFMYAGRNHDDEIRSVLDSFQWGASPVSNREHG